MVNYFLNYQIADEEDIKFYCYFDMCPLELLSNCQFDNEFRLGIEYGEDVCEFINEEQTESTCKDCPKLKQKTPWYPPITDQIIVNLILITGITKSDLPLYYNNEHKLQVFRHSIEQANNNESIRNEIRKLLQGHLQEWSRM